MKGISPKLPLTKDTEDGYILNHTYLEAVEQNLKNLILTNPGERIMDIYFGVGIKSFLFEQQDVSTYSHIATRIRDQVQKYMPLVEVNDIKILSESMSWTDSGEVFDLNPEDSLLDGNEINIQMLYTIDALATTSVLTIGI